MTKQEIINYVMNSPANTNPNVLGSMLDGITEEVTLLTEESVTTQVRPDPITDEDLPYATEDLIYSQIIDADTIQVTFEGEKYTCQKQRSSQPNTYIYGASIVSGAVDFSQFPFGISSAVSPFSPGTINNTLCTETAGTYQIKIEIPQEDGSSANEWSTAQVSFANNGESDYQVYISYIPQDSSLYFVSERVTIPGSSSEALTLSVPLYQNHYFLRFSSFDAANFNGSETIAGQIAKIDRGFLIEGDGTISLTGTDGR